jgi:hypothetical protein
MEQPHIYNVAHTHTLSSDTQSYPGIGMNQFQGFYQPSTTVKSWEQQLNKLENQTHNFNQLGQNFTTNEIVVNQPIQKEPEMEKTKRRFVQVFIMDPNENVPLDKALLYKGDQKLTESTDQELFFDVNISDVLSKHNEFRKTCLDKEASRQSGKDIYLEPARIRDLAMTVVNLVSF